MESTHDVIDPFVKGYAASNQNVSIFEFGNVVVARDYKEKSRVRLVSGGTCTHMQYVGTGMLTASVQGPGQRSPTPANILRTLRELSLNHITGILVIVQATSTDVLNFGVAVERAGNDDLRASMLSVSEDCKNGDFSKSGKRGLSGVVLVNKIAGALAENNKPIASIVDYCKKVIDNVISNSINVNDMLVIRECVYCKKCAQAVDTGTSHKKKSILKAMTFSNIATEVVLKLFDGITAHDKFSFDPEVRLVLLVNNMGALSKKQEYLFVKECIDYLNQYDVKIARFYIGSYLQLGYDVDLTLTVLKVFDGDMIHLLDYPCSAPGWIPTYQFQSHISFENILPGGLRRKCRLSPPIKGPKLSTKAMNVVQVCVQFACDALISCERLLNKMDSDRKGGDGDTGTRLKMIAEVLNKRMCEKKLYIEYPFTFFLSLSKLLENTVGSTMACLYCILFEAAANKFGEYKEEDDVTPFMWLEALEHACASIKKYGNVEEGDKTMYDPLYACSKATRKFMTPKSTISAFGMGVSRAEDSVQMTKQNERKYPDAGAHAVGIWLRAVYEGVKLRCLE